MHKPLIPLSLAYIAGILLGHGFLYLPYSTGIPVILVSVGAGALALAKKLSLKRVLLYAVPGLVGMAAYLGSAAWLPADHYARRISFDGEAHVLTGTISSPLDRDPDRTAFVVELSAIDGAPLSGDVRVSVREELSSLGYGDLVRVSGKMREPGSFHNPGGFDYAAYLAQRRIFATVSVRTGNDITLLRRGAGVFRTVQDWRERIRQAFLAETKGPGSAILQAMVLGEEGGLTDELRDRFQSAGVTHIISISGSHLGMVALLCFGLVRGLLFLLPERNYHRLTLSLDPKKLAAWLTLPLLIFYTLLAGGQMATIRSLSMITAGLAALVLDRDHALMHSLALAALLILAHSPQAVFDISFQLSYLSVLVIGYVVSVWNELGIQTAGRAQRFGQGAALLMIISLATSLATGPVVAYYFNQISLAGLVSNLVIVPFAGAVVVPLGLFSAILSLFTGHLPLAWMNQYVSDFFIGLVAFFSHLPFARLHPRSPGVLWLACYALFLLSLLSALRIRLVSRFKPLEASTRVPLAKKITLAAAGLLLVSGPAVSFIPRSNTTISFPDVGQGDCALIELASGQTVLIDGGGTNDNRFDIGRRVVAPFLWDRGIRRLDLVVLSHPDADHMNGLLYLVRNFPVAEAWVHGSDAGHYSFWKFLDAISEKHVPLRTVSPRDAPVVLGKAKFRVLHPARGFHPKARKTGAAVNSLSLVIRMEEGGRTFLFAGDIEQDAEQYMIGKHCDLKCDVLKVPHHGSKSSSSEEFLAQTRPQLAVVTVGKSNPYHHPADEVIERYERTGADICRTDRDGAVMIRINREGFEVTRWSELMLQRVALLHPDGWKAVEKQNWLRVGKRMAM